MAYTVRWVPVNLELAAEYPDGIDAQRLEAQTRIRLKFAEIDAHPHRDPRPARPWNGYSATQIAAATRRAACFRMPDEE